MHGSTIDVNQMQPHGKKRRIDWDSLDLHENGSGSSGSIGVVESKMPTLVTNGKDCERNRSKSVNGGEFYNGSMLQHGAYIEFLISAALRSLLMQLNLNLKTTCIQREKSISANINVYKTNEIDLILDSLSEKKMFTHSCIFYLSFIHHPMTVSKLIMTVW